MTSENAIGLDFGYGLRKFQLRCRVGSRGMRGDLLGKSAEFVDEERDFCRVIYK